MDKYVFDDIKAGAERDMPGYPIPVCDKPINDGQEHYLMNTAIADLNRWVTAGSAPPTSPRIRLTTGSSPAIARDRYGDALGGIRTPAVQAPTATESGEGNTPSGWCTLFGTSTPLPSATLARLYPSHGRYVHRVAAAAHTDLRAGFLTRRGAEQIVRAARRAPIPH